MGIPIVINNLNRLSTTKKLYEDLNNLGYYNIYIIDNGSTYKPLLEWYYWNNVQVLRNQNLGQLAIYNGGYMQKFKGEGFDWVVYTDSDIQLNPNTPKGFIEHIIETCEKHGITKGGLSLSLDNLPETELSVKIKDWESKYWNQPVEKEVFLSEIDTTFCCIKTTKSFDYKALRFAGDFTATHLPWYTDFNNLTEEEKYYLDHVNEEYSGYRREYNLFLNAN